MNPIALKHGRKVYAYACGRCGAVPIVGSYSGYDPAEVKKRIRQQVKESEAHARRCCSCSTCGAELPDETYGYCEPCRAKEDERVARVSATMREQYEARHARNEAAITAVGGCMESAFALASTMSDTSEECWCAGWLEGCEFSLWSMVQDPAGGDHEWGLGTVTAAEVATLRRLSEEAGGWWRWDTEAGGGVFVPMAEWLAMVETRGASGG